MQLLSACANAAMDYTVRVLPTHQIEESITEFDQAIADARIECLTPEASIPPACSIQQRTLANDIAQIPIRMGGFGHTTLAHKAAPAFAATLLTTADDPILQEQRRALEAHVKDTYERICKAIGVTSVKTGHPLSDVLPESYHGLVAGPQAGQTIQSKTKVQARVTQYVMEQHRLKIRQFAASIATSPSEHNKSLAIHIFAVTSRSQASRVLSAPLYDAECRIPAGPFVAWARFHLGLPQLLSWSHASALTTEGYQLDRCRAHDADSEKGLDMHGDHACSCKSQNKSRYRTHSALASVLSTAAAEAGVKATLEPATVGIMNNDLTPQEYRVLFPKKHTEQSRTRKAKLEFILSMLKRKDTTDEQR